MIMRYFLILIIVILISGCASTPKYKYVIKHDPILDQNGGVVLIVDVCNQIDVVGDDDYCIVKESKDLATKLAEEIRAYLNGKGISVRAEIIPFICGMYDNPENPPVFVAENKKAILHKESKPFGISDEIKKDAKYLNAISNLSTYIFERESISYLKDNAKKKDDFQSPNFIIPEDQFSRAVEVIKERTGASSLLYIGLKGHKLSGGKIFGQGVVALTVGMATGLATAGLGTGYWAAYIPGGDTDWWFSSAGVVNLETKKLSWDNYSFLEGDPLETANVTNYYYIKSLLHELLVTKVQIP